MAGFTLENDIMPSECLIFTTEDKKVHKKRCGDTRAHTPCLFEYVYLARPDSILDGISIYKSRLRMGDHLGRKILEERPDHGIDVVIPVPDTSRTAAIQVAYHLGAKMREGFIKNRYIGRTLLCRPSNQKKSVRQKLNQSLLN